PKSQPVNGHGKPDTDRVDWKHPEAFEYQDESGAVIYRNVRYPILEADGSPHLGRKGKQDKTFRQEHLSGSGQWIAGRGEHKAIPYRLPELKAALHADRTTEVFVTEGERKAELLRTWGFTATSIPQGAENFGHHFAGADVVILTDHDRAGRIRCDF